mmetsp:Transcript_20551/g.55343  ORF Transcript_20551/g.55343 Transcript_20551/m.55343 type:complete len:203 (+) Transcript_20551:363-971(+)
MRRAWSRARRSVCTSARTTALCRTSSARTQCSSSAGLWASDTAATPRPVARLPPRRSPFTPTFPTAFASATTATSPTLAHFGCRLKASAAMSTPTLTRSCSSTFSLSPSQRCAPRTTTSSTRTPSSMRALPSSRSALAATRVPSSSTTWVSSSSATPSASGRSSTARASRPTASPTSPSPPSPSPSTPSPAPRATPSTSCVT